MTTTALEKLSERRNWIGLVDTLGPFLGLLFVFLLFTILAEVIPSAEHFATFDNLGEITRHTAIIAMASIGMTLVIISGGIDLSVGSVMALTTVVIAQLLVRHWSASAAAVGGVLAAALCGLVIGVIVTRLKLPAFIVTLGMWGAVRGAAKLLAHETNVDPPNEWKQTWLFGLVRRVPDKQWWMLQPVGVWLTIALAGLVAAMLRYTRVGRHVYAIGSNEQTARLCGVKVDWTKILIYLTGSAFAGVAGLLEFSKSSHGSPTTLEGAELDVIAAVVIGGGSLSGGQGSVFRSLSGAMIIAMIANGCLQLGWPKPLEQIATGAIIVFAVALDRLRHRKEQKI